MPRICPRPLSPPPPLPPAPPLLSQTRSLITTRVHSYLTRGIQGCPKTISLDKNIWHSSFENLSKPPFFCHFASVHFCNTFCQKMLPFFHHSTTRESFPDFSFYHSFFHPCLTNANYLCRRIFGTSLFNPSRRASGFTREGGKGGETDNEPITPHLLPLVPEFINTEFHIYSFCTFKNFC